MSDVLDPINEWCNCDDPAGWHNHSDSPPAADTERSDPERSDPLDVERLAEALHAVGVGCSSDICEPTTSTYIGLRKTMHETDAREVAAEYARLAREGEQPVAGPDAPGSRPSTRHEHSEE
jgi:hypothetical protein